MLLRQLLNAAFTVLVLAPTYNLRSQTNEVSDTSVELTSLENNHHISEETVNSVIQNLKRGNVHAACATLQTNPKGIISSIIHKVHEEENKGNCTQVVDFIRSIDLESKSSEGPRCKFVTNFIKSIAYRTFFYIISQKISSSPSEMSECVFRLAWDVQGLWLSVQPYESQTLMNLRLVLIRLPKSVKGLVLDIVHIRRNSTPCKDFRKDILGDYQIWIGESYENKTVSGERGGEYFSLYDTSGLKMRKPLEGSAEGNKVYLGQNDDVQNPNRLWKPILVSDDQLQFQHKGSGKYLSYEVNGSCYMYVLSDEKTNWNISTGDLHN